MIDFKIHDENSAPQNSKKRLEDVKQQLGFIPNILATLAESSAALETYLYGMEQVHDKARFTGIELNSLLIALSSENQCDYCTKAHSAMALKQGMSQQEIDNIIQKKTLDNSKLNALLVFARLIVQSRGFVQNRAIEQFLAAGYGNQQILEIILLAGLKTITNYTNHIAHTTLDSQFK